MSRLIRRRRDAPIVRIWQASRSLCQQLWSRLSAARALFCSTSIALCGGPGDGFKREVDDLGAVELFAFFDAGAELGAGQMVA